MSLVTEYRKQIKEKLGLKEEDPAMVGSPSAANPSDQMGGMDMMDETTLNTMLELLTKEIAKREAVGETDDLNVDTKAAGAGGAPSAPAAPAIPGAAPAPGAAAGNMNEAEMLADDVFFEMLNTFKTNIANCEDANRKNMLRKCYETCYAFREKFIKEMVTPDEQ